MFKLKFSIGIHNLGKCYNPFQLQQSKKPSVISNWDFQWYFYNLNSEYQNIHWLQSMIKFCYLVGSRMVNYLPIFFGTGLECRLYFHSNKWSFSTWNETEVPLKIQSVELDDTWEITNWTKNSSSSNFISIPDLCSWRER